MTIIAKMLAAAAVLAALCAPASAGTTLQLQFLRWSYEGNGLARAQVSVRNATIVDFETVAWTCDLLDRDQRLIGRTPITFNIVPWGAITVDTMYVASNGMFETARCQFAYADRKTYENAHLNRRGEQQMFVGIGLSTADQYFNFNAPIAGRVDVISREEEQELERQGKAPTQGW